MFNLQIFDIQNIFLGISHSTSIIVHVFLLFTGMRSKDFLRIDHISVFRADLLSGVTPSVAPTVCDAPCSLPPGIPWDVKIFFDFSDFQWDYQPVPSVFQLPVAISHPLTWVFQQTRWTSHPAVWKLLSLIFVSHPFSIFRNSMFKTFSRHFTFDWHNCAFLPSIYWNAEQRLLENWSYQCF